MISNDISVGRQTRFGNVDEICIFHRRGINDIVARECESMSTRKEKLEFMLGSRAYAARIWQRFRCAQL